MIEARLRSVTLNYPSFHAQEQVTLARRLYQPPHMQLSADDFLKLQRRFTMGLIMLRERPEVGKVLEQLDEYNAHLSQYGMQDFEVESIELEGSGVYRTLLLRFVVLLGIVMLSIPGAALNAPLGLISRFMAKREAKRALQKSEVKVKAQDVLASYKVLVAVFLVPVAWFMYVFTFAVWFGLVSGIAFLFALPMFSYASVRLLEQGVQIWRSSAPILRLLLSTRFMEIVTELKAERESLVIAVRDLVEVSLPLLPPEFTTDRVVKPEDLRQAEMRERGTKAKNSLIGVNRRVYKAKGSSVVQDTFSDFANEMGSAPKPTMLGTSVEMERMHILRRAEEEQHQQHGSKK
jgi:glycerol-3-phosphate O-acyltransferase/dihydroxyacetone phosphate acyltransferase